MSDFIVNVADKVVENERTKKKTIRGVYIDDDVWAKLKEVANERGMTPSKLLRETLRAALGM
jgi:macrodomain Ter protein organizer (MatP/YcbG family)